MNKKVSCIFCNRKIPYETIRSKEGHKFVREVCRHCVASMRINEYRTNRRAKERRFVDGSTEKANGQT